MLARAAFRASTTTSLVSRRGFQSTRARLDSPYHYPEGPRSNLPFNPLTKWFALRFWGFCAVGFAAPFLVAANSAMRNLRNAGRLLVRFPDNPLPLAATAWDTTKDSLICAFGPSESSAVIELKRLRQDAASGEDPMIPISSWNAPCPLPSLLCDSILDLHYFSGSSTTCLILAGGDIILVREQSLPGEVTIEIVGSVDAGISAAAWSPDEEIVAITTHANTLLYMTREFESLTSITLSREDLKESRHVSVGWGKAETQFKGKRAKALRDPTMPEHVDDGVLSPHDDRSATISWRGDGAYVAINTVEDEKRRLIRVYSRGGLLDSVSEPVDGLEGALSWRPSGNIIAGVQRLKDGLDVVLFERNGLRHGQFSLRLSSEEFDLLTIPLTLSWNSDSSVLAVGYSNKVQLWTMGNYHYYLKQELEFPKTESKCAAINSWHPERPLRISVATFDAVQMLEYVLTAASGPTVAPNDFGLLCVIDGASLKLTPMRLTNIPPPMSLHQINLPEIALDAAVSAANSRIAILTREGVYVFALDIHKKPVPEPTLVWRCASPPNHYPRQIAFVSDTDIFLITDQWNGSASTLWKCEEQGVTSYGGVSGMRSSSNITSSLDRTGLFVQTSNGAISSIATKQSAPEVEDLCLASVAKFPSPVSLVQVVVHADENICFGLTTSGVLYANGRLLARNCTSFLVTSAHLIFTTTQHYIKFVHIAKDEDLEIPPDEPEVDERCRTIERGARLVSVMPSIYAVVLQMPRGNLETIYPRALVLAGIRKSIDRLNYKRAFLACRNQRVDMNIIHDHAPEQFMANIGTFVDQIQNVEHIDLFLSQLRDEDVSQTMYKNTAKDLSSSTNGVIPNGTVKTVSIGKSSKLNRVCDAFLKAFQACGQKYLQSIITAHVCKNPPDLDAGLSMIGELQAQQDPFTERIAEHICFLADVNQLYDNALGLYNLELALLIAQQSQKDPREYLPHLQSLHELSILRRKFQIDNQLARYGKALGHLYDLQAFEELNAYVEKHCLYTVALELFKYQPGHYNEIMGLYADYLNNNNQYELAAHAYESLDNYAAASDAWRSANLWEESLSSALKAGTPDTDFTSLATTLAEGLSETRDFFAAATIHLEFLSDVETAARMFCKGYYFSRAILVVEQKRQPALIEGVIDPGLVESSATMTELLADCKGQLGAQVPRLRVLRVKKAEDPLAFFDGAEHPDIPDNISLAPTDASTSAGTFMTRYTNRTGTINTTTTRKTSKNRRREERKRARGKKGSVYEEEYLVNSIRRLVERINTINEEVQRLVKGLVRRKMRERAATVAQAMEDVVGLCKESVDEVFQVEKKAAAEVSVGAEGSDRPVGADGVLWDSMEEAARNKEPPVVKDFERLSLI
ncbi:IkappaB kinase complex, IKAP component [Mytilinidion resinicola]|uniref:Elongator complex protein 1 n=1 Tax=Mytilinidion resinicola TaxID=574789 RepID=A0A6A6YL79_9PEZI|nr:IkappaB kinase complex, IKAP component [Mytilinidion resinicola]KAF2809632.1 IkappaB kinase complex, IKAP component [Mytilinidion resinicola]